ncbi:PucR family transcriptional regulator [Nocardia higoensis]|uniref:PucR family transcriptional regulator n=1 Tax=Nocardia higoensis TaxID=228599 RepID=UPI0002D4E183|nr:helix-turn-helix domain-containing protein [Nocardia higoensis]
MSIAAPDRPPESSAGRDGGAPPPVALTGADRTPGPRSSSTSRLIPSGAGRSIDGSSGTAAGSRSAAVAEIARLCRAVAARAFEDGKAPTETELDSLGEAALRWAGAALPLSTVLRACQEGLRTALDSATARTAAEDAGGVRDATDLMLELLRAVTTVVCDAYVGHDQDLAREHRAAGQALASALLSGQVGSAVARHSGLPIAESYQVIALAAPTGALDGANGPYPAPAAAGRGLQPAVTAVFGAQVPALLSPTGGTLLLARGAGGRELTAELLAELSAVAGLALSATAILADAGHIPEAAEQAHELLELARIAGRGPGFYRLDDLAMEYQLTRDGPAGRQLMRMLDPLDTYPELLDTARAYLRNDMNRRLTARQLFVHPNTVDYRLRRIGRLTGIDLATAAGIAQATAALLARDLYHAGRRRR